MKKILIGILVVVALMVVSPLAAAQTTNGVYAPTTNYVDAALKYTGSDAGYNNQLGYIDPETGDNVAVGSNHNAPTLTPEQSTAIGRLAPGQEVVITDTVTVPRTVVDAEAYDETVVDQAAYTETKYTYSKGVTLYVRNSDGATTEDRRDAKEFDNSRSFAGFTENKERHSFLGHVWYTYTYSKDVTKYVTNSDGRSYNEADAKLFDTNNAPHGYSAKAVIINHPEVNHVVHHAAVTHVEYDVYVYYSNGNHARIDQNGNVFDVGFEDMPIEYVPDYDYNDMNCQVIMTNVVGDLTVTGTVPTAWNNTLGNVTVTVVDPNGEATTYKMSNGELSSTMVIALGENYGEYTVTVRDSWRMTSATESFKYEGLGVVFTFDMGDPVIPLWMEAARNFYTNDYPKLFDNRTFHIPAIVVLDENNKVVKVILKPMNDPYYAEHNITVDFAKQWIREMYHMEPVSA